MLKKGRFFNLFQEILGYLYDRTGVEIIRTPSIRHVGGQVWADIVGFIDFMPSKNSWNFLIPISWLWLVHVPIFQNSLSEVLVDSQRSVFGFPQRATQFSLDTNHYL